LFIDIKDNVFEIISNLAKTGIIKKKDTYHSWTGKF